MSVSNQVRQHVIVTARRYVAIIRRYVRQCLPTRTGRPLIPHQRFTSPVASRCLLVQDQREQNILPAEIVPQSMRQYTMWSVPPRTPIAKIGMNAASHQSVGRRVREERLARLLREFEDE